MRIRLVLPLLALALAASACGRYLEASAAVVDGKPISMADLDAAVLEALRGQDDVTQEQRLETERRVLGQIIQDRIIAGEAEIRKIKVDTAAVEERYQGIRSQFDSDEELAQALAAQGVDIATVRDRIRLRLIVEAIQKELADTVKITPAQIKEAFGDGSAFQEVRARHIFFAVPDPSAEQTALKKAQDALARLRAGADFAALARQISEDPRTKASGGELGVLRPGAAQAGDLERAAFRLERGEISEPLRSQAGFHLIQVTGKGKKTLEQATPEIKEALQSQGAQEAFTEFITTRIRAARVEVNPRFGEFDPAQVTIVDRQFYTPAPVDPNGVPGLQLPLDEVSG
ncbi:MAG TPA: peptidylprolyl isomerase [Actinomycetota bacterium]|nr:peptidylprolyl isomerase [Actinomycetota bacterium]